MHAPLALLFQDVCGGVISPDGRFFMLIVTRDDESIARIAFPVEALASIEQTITRLKTVVERPEAPELIDHPTLMPPNAAGYMHPAASEASGGGARIAGRAGPRSQAKPMRRPARPPSTGGAAAPDTQPRQS